MSTRERSKERRTRDERWGHLARAWVDKSVAKGGATTTRRELGDDARFECIFKIHAN